MAVTDNTDAAIFAAFVETLSKIIGILNSEAIASGMYFGGWKKVLYFNA